MKVDFDKKVELHAKTNPDAPLLKFGHVLALDLSTKTGWAWMGMDSASIFQCVAGRILAPAVSEPYPYDFVGRANTIAESVGALARVYAPTFIIIEETNGSKSRYAQKMLEFIHCSVLNKLATMHYDRSIRYINSSDWRKVMGIQLTKEQKKQNQMLSRKLREGKSKKDIGIRGKITKKHLALNYVNSLFKEEFKVKDNDVAEAICLGLAYGKDITKHGFHYCDGK